MNQMTPEFATAIFNAMGMVEGAKKGRSNPAFKSKYADLGACWDACEEALAANGLAILQWPCAGKDGCVGLATQLLFKTTGECLTQSFDMPVKDPTNPQAVGSALTYARRYALCAVMGICPEDDDGNAGAKAAPAPAAPPNAAYVLSITDSYNKEPTVANARKLFKAVQVDGTITESTRQATLNVLAPHTKETK